LFGTPLLKAQNDWINSTKILGAHCPPGYAYANVITGLDAAYGFAVASDNTRNPIPYICSSTDKKLGNSFLPLPETIQLQISLDI